MDRWMWLNLHISLGKVLQCWAKYFFTKYSILHDDDLKWWRLILNVKKKLNNLEFFFIDSLQNKLSADSTQTQYENGLSLQHECLWPLNHGFYQWPDRLACWRRVDELVTLTAPNTVMGVDLYSNRNIFLASFAQKVINACKKYGSRMRFSPGRL